MQCVAPTDSLHDLRLKADDAVEVRGVVRRDDRARGGIEIDIESAAVLNRAANLLPFTSSSDISTVGLEILTEYRPLSLRNDRVGDVFRIQAAILKHFRDYLTSRRFTEIVSSKIVASGTEGGTNLFEIQYFDRVAYLAQSPQFYKEHGVAGFERVFETGHVYRAEPHATSRERAGTVSVCAAPLDAGRSHLDLFRVPGASGSGRPGGRSRSRGRAPALSAR